MRILLMAVVSVVLSQSALADGGPPSAIERYHALKDKLVAEKTAKDWSAFRQTAIAFNAFMNGAPASLLEIARADINLGDTAGAKPYLDAFLAMGQNHPVLDTPLFGAFKNEAAARRARNASPIALASAVFTFHDSNLIVEDIGYDEPGRRFFATTVRSQKIVALRLGETEHDFAQAPDHWPLLALKIDVKGRRLWATEVALEGFAGVPKAEQGRSAVLEYDIDTGKRLGRFELQQKAALGDMVLDEKGDPVLSDNTGGGLWRLHDGAFTRIDRGDFISPQTSTRDGNRILVPDYLRGVAAFNPSGGSVHWLEMQNRFALNGIDGLYVHGDDVIAVQNGAMPERVVEWTLDKDHERIISEKIIERASPTLGDPTHGVIVGNDFYYIANSGWDKLGDDGTPAPGAILTPAHIMRVQL
jgi:hypothetical protein